MPRRPGFAMLAAGIAALLTVAGAHLLTPASSSSPPNGPRHDQAGVFTAAALDDEATLLRLRAVDTRLEISRRPRARLARPPAHVAPPVAHRTRLLPGLAGWLARAETRKIRRCESDDDYTLVDYNRIPGRGLIPYFGAWQMDEEFVRDYAHVNVWDYVSHGRFTMPRAMQDEAAYEGWLARGDEPWACR